MNLLQPDLNCKPRFRVELLRDNPFPKGVLGSKAIGEPPFMSPVCIWKVFQVGFFAEFENCRSVAPTLKREDLPVLP